MHAPDLYPGLTWTFHNGHDPPLHPHAQQEFSRKSCRSKSTMTKKTRRIKVDTTTIETKISRLLGIPKTKVDEFCLSVRNLLLPEIGNYTIHSWLEVYLKYNKRQVSANILAEYIAKNTKSYCLKKRSHVFADDLTGDKELIQKVAKRLQGADNGNLTVARYIVADMKRIQPNYLSDEYHRGLFLWAIKILAKENNISVDNIINLMDKVLKPIRYDEYDYRRWEISTPMGTGGKRG
jgi:hypothetical protein